MQEARAAATTFIDDNQSDHSQDVETEEDVSLTGRFLLFGFVYHLLQRKLPIPVLFVAIFWESIQTASFSLTYLHMEHFDAGYCADVSWHVRTLALTLLGSEYLLALACALCAFLFGVIIILAHSVYRLSCAMRPNKTLIDTVSFLAPVSVRLLLVPTIGIAQWTLERSTYSWHTQALAAVSVLCAVLMFLLSMFWSLFVYDKRSFIVDGRTEVFYLFSRVFLACLQPSLSSLRWYLLVALIVSLLNAGVQLYVVPFFNIFFNLMRLSGLGILIFCSTCFFTMLTADSTVQYPFDVTTPVLICMCVLGAAVLSCLLMVRVRIVVRKVLGSACFDAVQEGDTSASSRYAVGGACDASASFSSHVLIGRHSISIFHRFVSFPLPNTSRKSTAGSKKRGPDSSSVHPCDDGTQSSDTSSEYGTNSWPSLPDAVVRVVDNLYCSLLSRDAGDPSVLIDSCFFMLTTISVSNAVRGEPSRRMRVLLTEAMRFMHVRLDHQVNAYLLRQYLIEYEGSKSLTSSADTEFVQRSIRLAQHKQGQLLAAYGRFWQLLLNPQKTSNMLMSAIAEIEASHSHTKRIFEGLVASYPRSPHVLRAFAKFVLDLEGDTQRYQVLLDAASRLEDAATEDGYSDYNDAHGSIDHFVSGATMGPTTLDLQSNGDHEYNARNSVQTFENNRHPATFSPRSIIPRPLRKRESHGSRGVPDRNSQSWDPNVQFIEPRDSTGFQARENAQAADARSMQSGRSSSSSFFLLARSRMQNRESRASTLMTRTLWLQLCFVSCSVVVMTIVCMLCIRSVSETMQCFREASRTRTAVSLLSTQMSYALYVTNRSAELASYSIALSERTATFQHSVASIQACMPHMSSGLRSAWQRPVFLFRFLPFWGSVSYFQSFGNLLQHLTSTSIAAQGIARYAATLKATVSDLGSTKDPNVYYAVVNAGTVVSHEADEIFESSSAELTTISFIYLVTYPGTAFGICLVFSAVVLFPLLWFSFKGLALEEQLLMDILDAVPKSVARQLSNDISATCTLWSEAVNAGVEADLSLSGVNRTIMSGMLTSSATSTESSVRPRRQLIACILVCFLCCVASLVTFLIMSWYSHSALIDSWKDLDLIERSSANMDVALTTIHAVDKSFSMPNGTDVASELRHYLAASRQAYDLLRYGDSSLALSANRRFQTALLNHLYEKKCNGPSFQCSSTDELFSVFLMNAESFAEAWMINRTKGSDIVAFLNTCHFELLSSSILALVSILETDVTTSLENALTVNAVVLCASIVLLAIVSVTLFSIWHAMLKQRKRVDFLLLMLPRKVLVQEDALRSYAIEGEELLPTGFLTWGKKPSSQASREASRLTAVESILFGSSPDGLLEISDTGHIVRANPTVMFLMGFDGKTLVGRHISFVIQDDDVVTKIMKELEPNSRRPQEDASNDVLSHPPQECLINRAQGSSLFVHATLISWFSKDMRSSKPLHMLFLRDMTAEKKKTDLLEIEKQRSEGLLKNILPASVAVRLNNGETSIADFCAQCTILFFDMAGFTAMSSKMTPQEVVSTLNTVYSGFDDIFVRHSVEKIKCIGDSVMVAAGVPEKRQDHAKVIIDVALDMVEHMHQINELYGSSINFRIGINSGPVVAGVLGKVKWAYDLFGDSVNLASRMESTSPLGRIQVSRSTYELTYTAFDFEERGPVDCKGKGAVAAYLVISPKQQLVDKK